MVTTAIALLAMLITGCTHSNSVSANGSHVNSEEQQYNGLMNAPFKFFPPRQAIRLDFHGLTVAERKVVLAVLSATGRNQGSFPTGKKADLFLALPKGVLTFYFGDHRYPDGVTPPGDGDCLTTQIGGCRQAYSVIGSEGLLYYPARGGGPGAYAGIRFSAAVPDVPMYPIDIAAVAAYQKYGVSSPWDMPWEYFRNAP